MSKGSFCTKQHPNTPTTNLSPEFKPTEPQEDIILNEEDKFTLYASPKEIQTRKVLTAVRHFNKDHINETITQQEEMDFTIISEETAGGKTFVERISIEKQSLTLT